MIMARGLVKRYGSTLAVDNLTFEVSPGRVTGFLGPNGSGKSTTMRMIMGLASPDAGEATVNGRRLSDSPWPLREIGAVLDAKAYHPGRRALDHLWALAESNDIARSRVDEVLDIVGLTAVASKRLGTFSLGMGQRVSIAAALLGDPAVLLFDEPVNGLDPEGIHWIRGLMKSLADEGRTVFVSSHLMGEMALTADHLIVIGRGHLISEMSTADFIATSSHHFVRVRAGETETLTTALVARGASVEVEPDGALAVQGVDPDEIAALAAEANLMLSELSPQSASLEEAYMEVTHDSVEYRGETGRSSS
jgi:ABC-2 type transport system ATP-binding protein